ncbi:hypothetical protein ASZ90_005286 [hydrocarbon metagenome]|uniref:Uncharacterized protein n=1 Tax=hydrocarbon metagenome TaxID=938273 RepID=A0A0W8FXA2_9ZZZZ
MSIDEMKSLVSKLVEEKLTELLGDPDSNSELKESVKRRLKASFESEEQGKIGESAEEFAEKLGLKW